MSELRSLLVWIICKLSFGRWLLSKRVYWKLAKKIEKEAYLKGKIALVYDHKVSCLAFGEYIYFLMLARFFLLEGFFVRLTIVDGEYRSDWAPLLGGPAVEDFLRQQSSLTSLVLARWRGKYCLEKIPSSSFQDLIKSIQRNNDFYILYAEETWNRRGTYNQNFGVLNALVSKKSTKFIKEFLLNQSDFEGVTDFENSERYVCLNIRRNLEWDQERNNPPEAIAKVCKKILSAFPDYRLFILSDSRTCEYVRLNALDFDEQIKKVKTRILFSADFVNSFAGTAYVLLRSAKYFQFNGGGLGTVAIYSHTPYLIVAKPCNETSWSYLRSFTPFQSYDQTFIRETFRDNFSLFD